MAGPIAVIASFRPKPGEEAEAERILRGMVEPTRSEPGNLLYDLYKRTDESGATSFHLFERYADGSAVEAHRATAHYKWYRAAIVDHLAEPIGVLILNAIDVEY